MIELISDIKENHGCEVVVNGLMQSLKYYLRLIKDLDEFMKKYSENMKVEVLNSTVVKIEHLEKWNEIMKEL